MPTLIPILNCDDRILFPIHDCEVRIQIHGCDDRILIGGYDARFPALKQKTYRRAVT